MTGKEQVEEAGRQGLLAPKPVAGEQATVLVSTHFTSASYGMFPKLEGNGARGPIGNWWWKAKFA